MSAKRWIAVAQVVFLMVTGCAFETGDDAAVAANDRAKSQGEWKLTLEGGDVLSVERMDIYVPDDEEVREIFEIVGDGVALVGEFPEGVTAGYGEDFASLVGKTIPIAASGGDPGEPKTSHVTIGGNFVPVTSGTFTVEKVSGKWAGSEGNKTLWGTVELRVSGPNGETVIRGKLAAHAVTWG